MAVFGDKIGFAVSKKTAPGVYTDVVEERSYRGSVLSSARRWQATPDSVNPNLVISNRISVIMDPYLNSNLGNLRYVVFKGTRWEITNVEIERPRVTLTLGGVYNGPKPK